jgi:hypothetical protein
MHNVVLLRLFEYENKILLFIYSFIKIINHKMNELMNNDHFIKLIIFNYSFYFYFYNICIFIEFIKIN